MSPRLERALPEGAPIILKVGGSLFIDPELARVNTVFVKQLLDFLQNEYENGSQTIVAVIGGGELARARKDDAIVLGVQDPNRIDEIGIDVAMNNARLAAAAAEARRLPARLAQLKEGELCVTAGITFCGGTTPGHTTDYVAVEAATANHQPIVFMISDIPGYLREENGGLTDEIIEEVRLSQYLKKAKPHEPGVHTPLDQASARLALEKRITIVLIGPDLENLHCAIQGKDFQGTIFYPE